VTRHVSRTHVYPCKHVSRFAAARDVFVDIFTAIHAWKERGCCTARCKPRNVRRFLLPFMPVALMHQRVRRFRREIRLSADSDWSESSSESSIHASVKAAIASAARLSLSLPEGKCAPLPGRPAVRTCGLDGKPIEFPISTPTLPPSHTGEYRACNVLCFRGGGTAHGGAKRYS